MVDPNEMLDTLKDVARRLNDLGIGYMVTGSVAMSVYATARTTMDIDVIVQIAPSNADKFARGFEDGYYVDVESIRRAQRHQSMFNILNYNTGVKVDCIIRKSNDFEAAKFSRRRRSTIGDIEFWVISKEDLILSKLDWAKDSHSERQFNDVRNLIESGADEELIHRSIERQRLQDVWKAFKEWKTRIEK